MFTSEQVANFYKEAFNTLRKNGSLPEISVEYYPYVNTNHTIRFRKEKIFVRISDSFESAPDEVHRSLAFILVAKLLGKRVPKAVRQSYREYVGSETFSQKALHQRKNRGTKRLSSPVGEHFDLEEMFEKLNLDYFNGELGMPELSWSQRHTYRRLGHHDPAHDTIIISRSLDARGVPEFVVEYVLYHEMLHLVHPVTIKNGRRFIHTPAFRRDEARFDYAAEAEEWIERNSGLLKEYAKRMR